MAMFNLVDNSEAHSYSTVDGAERKIEELDSMYPGERFAAVVAIQQGTGTKRTGRPARYVATVFLTQEQTWLARVLAERNFYVSRV